MADENDLTINIGANATGVEGGSRRAKAAIKTVTDESKGLDAAFRRLKSAIDPTFAATERYNRSLADAKRLLDADKISKQEYTAATKAAKAALDSETESITRNSAAGRAAAAEAKALKQQEAVAAKAAADAVKVAAREKAAAEKLAAREAAAAVKAAKTEEKLLAREAAEAAKQAARQKAQAEKAASAEALAAEKAAKASEKAAAREAASIAADAAAVKKKAEREAAQAARDAAKATEQQARAERQSAQAAQELRASIDPVYASQMRYNDAMQRATQLLMQGKLKQGEFTAIQRQAKAQMDINTRSLGRQNSMYVQLGYQAQDVTASLASGINPLVILAQQGGQTAAAMSMMGGTVGRVAAFFAGPWGAAIIGFTLLLGYLWQSEDEGKKKTLDLNDAESRRAATLRDLTEALKGYVAQQRESNNEQLTTLNNTNNQNVTDEARMRLEVAAAQKKVNDAQEDYNRLTSLPRAPTNVLRLAQLAAEGVAYLRLTNAQKGLATAQEGLKVATDAVSASRTALMQHVADETELDRAHERALQAITDAYTKSNQTLADYDAAVAARRAENERYTKAKSDEAEAHRKNEAALKAETKAIFQSREAAIQLAGAELIKEGYSPHMENFGVGDRKVGQHPGMGREAHGKFAIDVNIPGAGAEALNPVTKERMDKMVAAYQARGFRVLWNGKVYNPGGQGASYDIPAKQNQHLDHAHIEAPASIVGKPAGKGLANDLIADANRLADEQKRLQDEAMRDELAAFDFKKELAQDDLYQVLQIQDEKEARIKAYYGATSREAMEAARETIRIERATAAQALRENQDELRNKLELAKAAEDQLDALAAERRGGGEDALNFQTQNGLISERAALVEKGKLLDAEFAEAQAHENRMYTLKYNEILAELALENLPVKQAQALHAELEALEAAHLNTMQMMNAKQGRAVAGIQMQSASLMMSKWRDVASTITSSMSSAFQGLWTRTQTFQQTFINMADALVYKMADMGLKMFEDWVMRQLGMTAVKTAQDAVQTGSTVAAQTAQTGAVVAGEATRTGVKAAAGATQTAITTAVTGAAVGAEAIKTGAAITGAATQTAVGATAGIAEIGTRAATSAAGAFSSTVVIPFIGPVAAPVAAAAALAAVLGFGALISAEGGMGEVPSDQLAMVHKKEMILPAWIAEPMRAGLRTNGSNASMFGNVAGAASSVRNSTTNNHGGDTHLHYGPQYGGHSGSMDMEQLLKRDAGSLRRWMRKEMRNGTLQGGSRS